MLRQLPKEAWTRIEHGKAFKANLCQRPTPDGAINLALAAWLNEGFAIAVFGTIPRVLSQPPSMGEALPPGETSMTHPPSVPGSP